MRPTEKSAANQACLLQARRLALGQMIAAGGLPRPGQFVRAGLPILIRASDLAVAADVVDAVKAADDRRRGRLSPGPQF